MYCNNCGKFIGDDALLCDECRRLQEESRIVYSKEEVDEMYAEVEEAVTVPPVDLKKPIIATVLTFCSALLEWVLLFFSVEVVMTWPVGLLVLLSIVFEIPGVIGVIIASGSLSPAIRGMKARAAKRVPALILCIVSVVLGIVSLYCFTRALVIGVFGKVLVQAIIKFARFLYNNGGKA